MERVEALLTARFVMCEQDYQSIQEQLLRVNRKYKTAKAELAGAKKVAGVSRPADGPPVDFGGQSFAGSAAASSSGGGGKRKKH